MRYGWSKVAACVVVALSFATTVRAEELDQSTPKKAALVFAKAVMAGDMATVKAVSTGTDAEFAMVKLMSDLAGSLKKLEDAAVKKFGAEAKLPKEMAMDIVGDVETADEKIDGDTATLAIKSKPDDKYPPTLKKTGDKWTVDLSNLSKDPQSAPMTKMVPAMVKVLDTVAKNIGDDKYKTTVEAYTDLGAQMGAVFASASPEPGK